LVEANQELTYASRLALLDQVAQTIQDLTPALFLVEQFDLFAVRRDVSGFEIVGRVPAYENISLEE